jgi:hypothetical protein
MDTAPKGGGAERVDDPKWVQPPLVLLKLSSLTAHVCLARWDWYYAEGGAGYRPGRLAWVEDYSGEPIEVEPIAWCEVPE